MIKNWFIFLSLCFVAFGAKSQNPVLTNYSYKFKINGLKDTSVYLGFHFGEKKYIRDTARVNSKGEVEFKGNDTIIGGMYLFVLPNKKWFEFVLTEKSFTLETDTADFIGKMKVKGSVENTIWLNYLRYMQEKQKAIDTLKRKQDAITDKESKEFKEVKAKLDKENDDITKFRLNIMKENPNAFVTKMFTAMKDVEIPDPPKNVDGSLVDSAFAYKYFRAHYWDNIDLLDPRIPRTPIFEGKLQYYFDKLIPQAPDSIIAEADKFVARVKADKEMFKFVVHHITYNFERSQIMCMDAVFVHMVDNYYKNPKPDWVDQKTLDKMYERADKLRPVLCGKKVMNIILPDTAGIYHALYDLKNDISILYFWDATCSHCKKQTPVLKEIYFNYLRPTGIEVFGVEGELDDTEWIKYTREHQIPWINVSDNPDMNKHPEKYIYELKVTDLNSLNFRHHFDLSSYPVIFVLDKDKKIIAKKLNVEQLKDFIEKYRSLNSRPK